VSYTSPTFSGAQVQVGLFQPKQFSGDQTNTPGLQAGLTFGAGPAKLWTSVVTQKTECKSGSCASAGYTANGYELGGKVGLGGAEVLAYAFGAKGLGLSTVGAQFFGGADAAGNKTKSDGYLVQATYKIGDTKLGINYGQNKDKGGLLGSGNVQKNKSYTLGVYHSLNKYLTLTGEVNNEKKPGVVFLGEKNNTISLGAIAFF
jgi:Gram-negative porin